MCAIDADIVCSRAPNHYDPQKNLNLDDSNTYTGTDAEQQVKYYRDNFKPLHPNMGTNMYFS